MAENQNFDLDLTSYTTQAIYTGRKKESWDAQPVVPPIMMTSNFIMDIDKTSQDYVYTRTSNPTRRILDECLTKLDGGKYGITCASGLAALSIMLSSTLHSGDHMIYGQEMYGGSTGLIRKMADRYSIQIEEVDTTDISNVERAIKSNTKLIYVETPSNPLLVVTDLEKLSTLAKKHNILTAVDNTYLTSYFQRPLELGIDIVLYSLSKYVSGHSDLIMGALIMNDPDLYQIMKTMTNSMGVCPSPFNCWLMHRSIRTLSLRMERHMKNGQAVAEFLLKHPAIEKVIYTGFPSHPQYEISKRQTTGHNGMVTFYIKGDKAVVKIFVKSLKMIMYAGSLGNLETILEIPTLLSHEKLSDELKQKLGITDNLVRMSVGIESPEDIIKDLDQALRKATNL